MHACGTQKIQEAMRRIEFLLKLFMLHQKYQTRKVFVVRSVIAGTKKMLKMKNLYSISLQM
jgi:ribosome biogenesis protein Nip4